jgi:hypothetical protein
MRKVRLVLLFILVTLLLSVGPDAAMGQPPSDGPPLPEGVQVLPELGPAAPGQTPGVNGYKVFGPNAVRKVRVQPLAEGMKSITPLTLYRSGYTDAWYFWLGPFAGYAYFGSHTSDSDLWEQQIWVDGFLKRKEQRGWMNTCSTHTSGWRAHCNTSFQWESTCAYGESYHFFHTPGYQDDRFITRDQAGPLWECWW